MTYGWVILMGCPDCVWHSRLLPALNDLALMFFILFIKKISHKTMGFIAGLGWRYTYRRHF